MCPVWPVGLRLQTTIAIQLLGDACWRCLQHHEAIYGLQCPWFWRLGRFCSRLVHGLFRWHLSTRASLMRRIGSPSPRPCGPLLPSWILCWRLLTWSATTPRRWMSRATSPPGPSNAVPTMSCWVMRAVLARLACAFWTVPAYRCSWFLAVFPTSPSANSAGRRVKNTSCGWVAWSRAPTTPAM